MNTATNLSRHAAVAKLIRAELKKHNIAARVTTKSYSGGESVNVKILQDVSPGTRKAIEAFCYRFQLGHFNGMTDSYEYSNRDTTVPQVRFVFVEVAYSDEIQKAARAYIESISGIEGYEIDRFSWMALNGSWGDFWTTRKPRVRSEVAA